MFEKLLDLNKLIGVNDICVQLNLNEVNKKAGELLQLYTDMVTSQQRDLDMCHPQYAAMAVYQACKLSKLKVSKSKIMAFSNLRPSQWQHLEQRWDKFLIKQYKGLMDNRLKGTRNNEQKSDENKENYNVEVVHEKRKHEVEDYYKWKQKMIKMAQEKLEFERNNSVNNTNDHNLVLS